MVKAIDDGGQAFPALPYEVIGASGVSTPGIGMTRRQYHANSAMQGLLSSPEYCDTHHGEIAELAFEQADAMIACEKQEEQTRKEEATNA